MTIFILKVLLGSGVLAGLWSLYQRYQSQFIKAGELQAQKQTQQDAAKVVQDAGKVTETEVDFNKAVAEFERNNGSNNQ